MCSLKRRCTTSFDAARTEQEEGALRPVVGSIAQQQHTPPVEGDHNMTTVVAGPEEMARVAQYRLKLVPLLAAAAMYHMIFGRMVQVTSAQRLGLPHFYIDEGQTKCFLEDVGEGIPLTITYANEDNPGTTIHGDCQRHVALRPRDSV